MKRWIFDRYGDPTVLKQEEIKESKLKAGHIGVKVLAFSINPIDWKLMSGTYKFLFPVKFPSAPCFDLAGTVHDNNGIAEFKKGDKVFVRLNTRNGGAACSYAVVDPSVVAKMPAGLSYEEAACIPLAALTALQGLRDHGKMKMNVASQRVLVVGGSGGVGHFAVQIAVAAGANVTAVCGTSNVDMVRNLGAHHVIDYRKQKDFKAPDNLPYDLVFDCVGSSPLQQFIPFMTKNALYVTPVPTPKLMCRLLQFWRRPKVKIYVMKADRSDLNIISQLIEGKKLKVSIDSTFDFDQLPQAFERSLSGRTVGKIVVQSNHNQ